MYRLFLERIDISVSIILCYAVLSCSVMSNSLQRHGLQPARLLCSWGFSRQEYWSGLPDHFQGIFPTQGIELMSPVLSEPRIIFVGTPKFQPAYLNSQSLISLFSSRTLPSSSECFSSSDIFLCPLSICYVLLFLFPTLVIIIIIICIVNILVYHMFTNLFSHQCFLHFILFLFPSSWSKYLEGLGCWWFSCF